MTNAASKCEPAFTRILLATDFSEASKGAFKAALALCMSLRAHLCILHVFEDANVISAEPGGRPIEIDSLYQAAQVSLDTLVMEAIHAGVHCCGFVSGGIVDSTILDKLASLHMDLAIVGTRALHGFERLVFGSTAEAIIRKAMCPILTVGPQAASHASRAETSDGVVVFATDFHESTTEAFRYASFFSAKMHLPLHCLHVLPRALEDGSHKEDTTFIITDALKHLASSAGGFTAPVCAVSYGSEISNAVVEYAKRHNAKLIVLGVRRASFMASYVPSHIAYRVITEAPCPLLTIAYPRNSHTFKSTDFRAKQAVEIGKTVLCDGYHLQAAGVVTE